MHRPIGFLAVLILLAAGCATAQPLSARHVPPDAASMRMSFAPVVRKAAPAVVNVYSRRVVRAQVDPFWGLFAGTRERTEQSLGSGSIVRADGVVLTNHHVIAGAQEIMVVTSDRREWPATVLLDDPRADLAVLKINAKGEHLPTIAIDEADQPQVGDLVLAIGDPFGVGQTVTNGIVSALARSDVGISDYASFIQTDAPINPGNSGGPLVDMAGNLIGVNTAILSGSGTSSGVGFAIPAVMARQVVDAALGGVHAVVRPWLGVRAQALTGEMARSMGLEAPRGVVVTDVWPRGPAAAAGVERGDVIESIGGHEVDDQASLNYRAATAGVGAPSTLLVRRGTAPAHRIEVRAEVPPSAPAADPHLIAGRNPLSGATLINLSPGAALERGLDPFSGSGVMVSKVDGGFAQNLGLQPGDFVRSINGRTVSTSAEAAAAVAQPSSGWRLTIERDGRLIQAQFSG